MKKIYLLGIAVLLIALGCLLREETKENKVAAEAYHTVIVDGDTIDIPEGFYSIYPPYSDGWCRDLTKYNHPTWSDERIEDYIFLGDSLYQEKYSSNK